MPGEAASSLVWLLGIEDFVPDVGAVAGAVVGVGVGVVPARAREAGDHLAEGGH